MSFAKIGPYLGWAGAGIGVLGTVVGGLYAVAIGMGWVVPRADAQEIAKGEANTVQQALIKEQDARSKRDLQLQMDLIVIQLSYLDESETLTPAEERRKESLERQLVRVEEELREMEKHQ